MIGTIILHYKILEKLGEGGMGIVYKAHDTKLDRLVALKFLPPELTRDPEAKERFTREAQAASALQHDNICTIHDVDETLDGQLFICMDFYEGETLKKKIERGPLPIDQAIDLGMQAAEGLQRAHEAAMVHRDIKPANIMVTKEGEVKIVDFGLVKLAGQTKLTKTGSTLGTVAYMSPEQARGEELDHGSDIWSLGVVLYEMITGQLPFKSEYPDAVVYSILNESPQPVTGLRTGVPVELERIIDKCIEKKASDRYQHMDELLVDLKRTLRESKTMRPPAAPPGRQEPAPRKRRMVLILGVAAITITVSTLVWMVSSEFGNARREKSIAVLPFASLSKTEDDQSFADGIHDEILTHLSKISGLKVKARTSVLQYRDTKKRINEIGKELGVSYLLEGSVQRAGDRVRVRAQLIDARSEDHLWAEPYDRPYSDIFAIQSEVAQKIASALKATLTPRERSLLEQKPTENLIAYDYYLKGNLLYESEPQENIEKAAVMYEKAVALDSTFALAYAGLSKAKSILIDYDRARPPERVAKARWALDKAIRLAPDHPEVHQAEAVYYWFVEADSSRAWTEFQTALKDEPDNSNLLFVISDFLVNHGDIVGANDFALRAYELDPSAYHAVWVMGTYGLLRNLPQWERWTGIVISHDPESDMGYWWKWRAAVWGHGNLKRGREIVDEEPALSVTYPGLHIHTQFYNEIYSRDYSAALQVLAGDKAPNELRKAFVFALMGNVKESRAQAEAAVARLSKLERDQPYSERYHLSLAMALARLGRKQEALVEISKGLQPRAKVANWGRPIEREVAEIRIVLGDYEKAIDELEYLLSVPSELTVASLRLDPIYDPLRNNPRFQALLARTN